MIRGEIWTASGGQNYAGKPRPVVIVQSDRFSGTASVTVCPFTSDPSDIPMLRPAIQPSLENGLENPSRIMIEKISTIPRPKLGRRVGRLAERDMNRVTRAIAVFLGLAD
jgi:mRNA interferase MazF